MFSSSEEGGGASSGPSAKMMLTKIAVNFVYKKKLGWQNSNQQDCPEKRRMNKL